MMSRVQKGMMAGLAATVVVVGLEAVNMVAGPWFTPFPNILSHMLGMDGVPALGWVTHVLVGTVVLGGLFGIVCPRLPTDTYATKGIAFAVASFGVLMTAIFLVGDRQTFSGDGGFGVVAWLLITNVVFGIVMGLVYGRLVERDKRMAREMAAGVPAH